MKTERIERLGSRLRHIPSRAWFAGILLLAVILRGWYFLIATGIKRDSLLFIELAAGMAAGDGTALFRSPVQPLYPALMALGARFGLAPGAAGQAVSFAAGIATVCIGWRIGRLISGRAFFAPAVMFLFAVHPFFIRQDILVLRDSLYVMLFAAAVCCLLQLCRRPGWKSAVLLGCTTALACFTRREGVELLLFWAVASGFAAWNGEGKRLAGFLGLAALAAAVCAVLLGAWFSLCGYDAALEFSRILRLAGGVL